MRKVFAFITQAACIIAAYQLIYHQIWLGDWNVPGPVALGAFLAICAEGAESWKEILK